MMKVLIVRVITGLTNGNWLVANGRLMGVDGESSYNIVKINGVGCRGRLSHRRFLQYHKDKGDGVRPNEFMLG